MAFCPFNWMGEGENVVYGGFQQGTYDALALLQIWYDEGLIDPDFITDNIFSTGKDKFKNGIVGFMTRMAVLEYGGSNSLPNLMKQINPTPRSKMRCR